MNMNLSCLITTITVILLASLFKLSICAAEVNLGTTIVALRTANGVVVGSDTRTSQSTMVSNRFADKISVIHQRGSSSCLLCRSGSAADTQHLADETRWEFRARALRHGMEEPSIGEIARWLRFLLLQREYSASLLCVGYDPPTGGKIFSISTSGALLEETVYAAAGSGSAYIIGLLDSRIKALSGNLMEEDEAVDFVAHLIHRAMARDQASGGAAKIVIVNHQGIRTCLRLPTEHL